MAVAVSGNSMAGHMSMEKIAPLRVFGTDGNPNAFLSGVQRSWPIVLFLQWQCFHQIGGLSLGVNLSVDNCHAGPTCCELAVAAVIQQNMLGGLCGSILPSEAFVMMVPQVPVALNWRLWCRWCEPSECWFLIVDMSVTTPLKTEPF